ncbi:MAG: hypothetical protein V1893_01460 [Candidatus Omnitrophota bacterium]
MMCINANNILLLGICSFIIGIVLFIGAIKRFKLFALLVWALVALCGIAAFFAGAFYKSFHEFNKEELVARVCCERTQAAGYDFGLVYTPVIKGKENPAIIFPMKGKEWMLSGDIVKWKPYLTLIGARTYYRITRLSGRYPSSGATVEENGSAYSLGDEVLMSVFLRKVLRMLPFVDATYGNAAYTGCEIDKDFNIYVGVSGFIIREKR